MLVPSIFSAAPTKASLILGAKIFPTTVPIATPAAPKPAAPNAAPPMPPPAEAVILARIPEGPPKPCKVLPRVPNKIAAVVTLLIN